MDCMCCGSAAVTERPERTARGYRRFRCRACGKVGRADCVRSRGARKLRTDGGIGPVTAPPWPRPPPGRPRILPRRREDAMSRLFGPLRQVGFVVRDVERAMRHWVEVCGVGPWFHAADAV